MPRYSPEFKQQAVERLKGSSKSLYAVSQELGVSDASLKAWLRQSEQEATAPSRDAEKELQEARRQIRRLEMEQEILKKAMAFFARENE
jgi:transposase-like protein